MPGGVAAHRIRETPREIRKFGSKFGSCRITAIQKLCTTLSAEKFFCVFDELTKMRWPFLSTASATLRSERQRDSIRDDALARAQGLVIFVNHRSVQFLGLLAEDHGPLDKPRVGQPF